MKEIKLPNGMIALVDDEDYNYLNQWNWCVTKSGDTYYAQRNKIKKDCAGRGCFKMHRVIMNTPKDMEVDHIDHNGLNCQKINMRNCTKQENACNRKSRINTQSDYLGVTYNRGKYIVAQIKIWGRVIRLGTFKTEIEAAYAYDIKAKELHGEFANLNFK